MKNIVTESRKYMKYAKTKGCGEVKDIVERLSRKNLLTFESSKLLTNLLQRLKKIPPEN